MLENFIFSVNAVFPIFIVLFAGYIMRRKNFTDENTIFRLNTITYKIALPIMLFRDVSSADFFEAFDVRLVSYVLITSSISVVMAWAYAIFFIKERKSKGAFVQGCFRSNYALIGLPLAASILGNLNTGKGAIITSIVVPFYSVVGIIVLTFYNDQKRQNANIFKIFILEILKNPLIIGIFFGAVVSLLRIKLPVVISSSLNYFANLATPIALIAIGGNISINSIRSKFKLASIAAVFKLVIFAAIFVPVGCLMKMDAESLVILLVCFGSPVSVSSYIISVNLGSDGELAANIILVTTLFSIFTFTLAVFLLKNFGFI